MRSITGRCGVDDRSMSGGCRWMSGKSGVNVDFCQASALFGPKRHYATR